MFLFRASRYLQVLANFGSDISTACHNTLAHTSQDFDLIRVDREAFISCPDEFVDYAVMEKLCNQGESADVAVVPLDAGWNDIGPWSELWEVNDKDALMVAHKDKLQDVKLLVDVLKADQRSEYKIHREVYRPWEGI